MALKPSVRSECASLVLPGWARECKALLSSDYCERCEWSVTYDARIGRAEAYCTHCTYGAGIYNGYGYTSPSQFPDDYDSDDDDEDMPRLFSCGECEKGVCRNCYTFCQQCCRLLCPDCHEHDILAHTEHRQAQQSALADADLSDQPSECAASNSFFQHRLFERYLLKTIYSFLG